MKHIMSKEYDLGIFDNIIVGRMSTCDIILEDLDVSRHHVGFEKYEGNYYVTDLGSSEGSTLNGGRLMPFKKQELSNESIVKFSSYDLRFNVDNELEISVYKNL